MSAFPFDTPAKAYAEAERRIGEAYRNDATTLDLSLPALEDMPASIAKLGKVEQLSINYARITDLDPLNGLPRLQEISASYTPIRDIAALSTLPALTILRITHTPISDLRPLAEIKALRGLWLNATDVADISILSYIKNLQSLKLDATKVTDLTPLADLRSLESVSLSQTQVSYLKPLSRLSKLLSLSLDDTQVAELRDISNLISLQALRLENTRVVDIGPLSRLAAIEVLRLSRTRVSKLSPISGLHNLQDLRLTGTQVIDLEPLSALTRLQTLWLDKTAIKDLKPLSELTELRVLLLGGTNVEDLTPLSNLTSLRDLRFSGTNVLDLSPLTSLSKIRTLSLAGTEVSDVAPLGNFNTLEHLWLDNTRVSDLEPLEHLASLRELRLAGAAVRDLRPIARLITLADAAQHLSGTFKNGLTALQTPASRVAPLNRLLALPQPAATVETINHLRRQQGLPEHIPEGYEPPDDPWLKDLREGKVRPAQDESRKEEKPNVEPIEPPPVPPQNPAEVETVERDGKLFLPAQPMASDLAPSRQLAMQSALKDDMLDLVKSYREGRQTDKRFASYLEDIAQNKLFTRPMTSTEVFSLERQYPVLLRYARTVNAEWDALLAARYYAVLMGLDELVQQFPEIRDAKANANKGQPLTQDQIDVIPELVQATADILREAEGPEFIDGAIPVAIEATVESPLEPPPLDPDQEPPPDDPDEKKLQAQISGALRKRYDSAIESVNNAWKGICRLAFKGWDAVKPERDELSKQGSEARASNRKSLGVVYKKLLTAPFKWLEKAVTGKLSTKGKITSASVVGLGGLTHAANVAITKFPGQFTWLERAFEFVRSCIGLG